MESCLHRYPTRKRCGRGRNESCQSVGCWTSPRCKNCDHCIQQLSAEMNIVHREREREKEREREREGGGEFNIQCTLYMHMYTCMYSV